MNRLRDAPRWALNAFAALALMYLFLPMIWIVWFSFNDPLGEAREVNIVWERFTLDNWLHAFEGSAYVDAFLQSLKIAAISTSIATVLGSMIAISLSRYRFRGSAGLNLLLILPLTAPEIVMGSSLATLFIDNDVNRGFRTVIIAHVSFQISFVAMTVRARVRGFDWTLEQAAQDLGASPMRTFWKVTFPLILPGIAAAALLSFALSVDDYIITLFNAGTLKTFPIFINSAFKREFPPQINVLASLVLVVSVTLMALGVVFSARRERAAR